MTMNRINHRDHSHPSTWAAREACRKAMRTAVPEGGVEPTVPSNVRASVNAVAHSTLPDGSRTCDAKPVPAKWEHTDAPVTCKNCLKKIK